MRPGASPSLRSPIIFNCIYLSVLSIFAYIRKLLPINSRASDPHLAEDPPSAEDGVGNLNICQPMVNDTFLAATLSRFHNTVSQHVGSPLGWQRDRDCLHTSGNEAKAAAFTLWNYLNLAAVATSSQTLVQRWNQLWHKQSVLRSCWNWQACMRLCRAVCRRASTLLKVWKNQLTINWIQTRATQSTICSALKPKWPTFVTFDPKGLQAQAME